mmetsp:Transcript_34304/g.98886  ORF Transcript_34304/g.98886 Transcript_34304/m.98886 type:complete len:154 (-) Transcript_34304:125-586(-)
MDGSDQGRIGNAQRRRMGETICQYWWAGLCTQGAKCRFQHPGVDSSLASHRFMAAGAPVGLFSMPYSLVGDPQQPSPMTPSPPPESVPWPVFRFAGASDHTMGAAQDNPGAQEPSEPVTIDLRSFFSADSLLGGPRAPHRAAGEVQFARPASS